MGSRFRFRRWAEVRTAWAHSHRSPAFNRPDHHHHGQLSPSPPLTRARHTTRAPPCPGPLPNPARSPHNTRPPPCPAPFPTPLPPPTRPPGVRTVDSLYKLKIFIQIAMLYLEDDDPVSAETFIKKASSLIAGAKDAELELQYKTSYARIMDAKRRCVVLYVGLCVDRQVCGGVGGGGG